MKSFSDAEWQEGTPTEKGVYERNFGKSMFGGHTVVHYSKWDGLDWYAYADDVALAGESTRKVTNRYLKWRKIEGLIYVKENF